jgi:nitrogen regulatory protein P-II 1
MMVQVIVPDHLADQTLDAIVDAAYTGKVGDGKVFVSPIEQLVRIRTGETAEAAV